MCLMRTLHFFFFLKDPPPPEFYPFPLPAALPIPDLTVKQATLVASRRERLPGIGTRLVVERALQGCTAVTTVVTLYDDLPWMDIENRDVKPRSEEHTSELQSQSNLVCRLLLEKKT